MDLNEFKQLLEETEDKLSIFGSIEILRQYKINLGELYDTIHEYLNNEEIPKLLEYPHFQRWDSNRRKRILLMVSDSGVLIDILKDEEKLKNFKSWDLKDIIKKLNDSDKEKLLNTPGWFKKYGFSTYEITEIIKGINEGTKYNIISNPVLIKNMLQLNDYEITKIISTLEKEESKDKLLDIYQFDEYLQVDVATTYSDKGKEKFLSNSQLMKNNRISILRSFDIDNLITYINNSENDLSDLGIYEIIMGLDGSHQEEFISKLNKTNLTLDEKREILATLKPEIKQKIDVSQLEPILENSLNIETTEYGGKVILDLATDLEQYRGLDRLLSVNPTMFDEKERNRFKQLCDICPELTVNSTLDSKENEDELKIERPSTVSEYIEAEKWVDKVLKLLKPEYTNMQKIAIIDNEIGKRISYSPDFDTEVFNSSDCRALYTIISSGYGVCNGIARVEQYLFERAGLDIECEIIASSTHSFIKLKDVEFELDNGETVVGTTILDPTWNLTAHRFGGRPDNFCMSYEEARKKDIDIDGIDHQCHKNDEELSDAKFNLDESSLRNLFKSVGLAEKDGDFPIKYLIDESDKLHQTYANDPLKNIEEQFALLQKVCPEFASCQNSTMSILQSPLLDNEYLKYKRCVVNRVYDRLDKDKRPITFVYINFGGLGEKFYYADKGAFIDTPKKKFLEKFECYEADLEKSNGIKPWEQSEETKVNTNLAQSSGTIIAHEEEEER